MNYTAAHTLDEALAAVASGARPVAGGSDLVVAARQGKLPLPESLVAIHGVTALGGITVEDGALVLGALACIAFYWLDPIALSQYHDLPPALDRVSFEGAVIAAEFAVVVPALYYLFRFRDIPSVAGRIAGTITGIVYAGFLTTYLANLKLIEPKQDAETFVLGRGVAGLADTSG